MNQVRLACSYKEKTASLFINVSPAGFRRLESEIILRSPEDEKVHVQHVNSLSEENRDTLWYFWHDLGFFQ